MRFRFTAAVFLPLLCVAALAAQGPALGPAERIADGVVLYRLNDPGLLDPPGPIAVQALRIDPAKMSIQVETARPGEPALETVAEIAARRRAVAAVNAGFFSMQTGKPSALLKKDGALVGRTSRPRGAVAVIEGNGRTRLLFDRVTAGAAGYRTLMGSSPKDWARARFAISGAGLLLREGRVIDDWADERIAKGFDTTRHPRTVIGVDGAGMAWLITVDGRNPALSLGMSFRELQGLARRFGLRSALNLDGGGSTTMVAAGTLVNHPSDPAGPRRVSDAILVLPRR